MDCNLKKIVEMDCFGLKNIKYLLALNVIFIGLKTAYNIRPTLFYSYKAIWDRHF